MSKQIAVDAEALIFIIQHGQGPYRRTDGEGNEARFWHKEQHAGPDTCVGCALEAGLATSVS